MRPCPCGWAGDPCGRCRCSGEQIARYRARVSGPLLDRIDLILEVPRLAASELRRDAPRGEASAVVAKRVQRALDRQLARCGLRNARMSPAQLESHASLGNAEQSLLEKAVDRLQLSARVAQRMQRVARTIADLAASIRIEHAHLAEAIQLRRLDLMG